MARVVVVGGGWAGCAAALAANKAGAEVILLERTDCLLGTGLVGGIMRNNGRFTAAEEMIAMGGGELFQLADKMARHTNIEFPGHKHANLYDVAHMEPAVRRYLLQQGVELWMMARACQVEHTNGRLEAVSLEDKELLEADVFVEEVMGKRPDGSLGAMSGSCKLHKDSVDPAIAAELNRSGVVVVPLPKEMVQAEKLAIKSCQQYALPAFAENLVLLDTGHVKLMTSYYPLEELRSVRGMENARYEDPYAGGKGNSIRFLASSPRDDHLRVDGLHNLFCGGEKAGLFVGHTEAICTGTLAGHNAARQALGLPLVTVPRSTAVGEAIAYVREEMQTEDGLTKKFTFAGSVLFAHLQELDLYTTDVADIAHRVEAAGSSGMFSRPLS
jgi:hypothetical protein